MRLWMLAALVAGCATTGTGTKTAQRYTGYPYDITDEGNRISGLVCGVNVDYSIAQRGDVTSITGFGGRSQFIEVRDEGGQRHVTGSARPGPIVASWTSSSPGIGCTDALGFATSRSSPMAMSTRAATPCAISRAPRR